MAPEWIEQAQDDAELPAIRYQERAGLDILTDGEMRRQSYSNRFATAAETLEIVAARIHRALPYVGAERLVIAPDCG